MAGILIHAHDEDIHLTSAAADRLLKSGSGDAALLYLAILRTGGDRSPLQLGDRLKWERPRTAAAAEALVSLGLIRRETPETAPEDARPDYSTQDITERLNSGDDFRALVDQVQQELGRPLSTADISMLLELCDYLGLPYDVVYLLVCHCLQRAKARGWRWPGMRTILKEGYIWARKGIRSQTAAAEYLKHYAQQQELIPRYMAVLQLGERAPVALEEKYLKAWQEMGFPPESVAIAYDHTVFNCHELRWSYLNKILKRWHEAGLHAPHEIEQAEIEWRKSNKYAGSTVKPAQKKEDDLDMLHYLSQLHQKGDGA